MSEVKKYLVIQWTGLPKTIKECVRDWLGFHNDCMIPASRRSEFTTEDYPQGMSVIEDYWKDQQEVSNYQGTLQDFIRDYGLEFDVWVIEQNFNLEGIDDIIVEISW